MVSLRVLRAGFPIVGVSQCTITRVESLLGIVAMMHALCAGRASFGPAVVGVSSDM
jgi:hypothetical protein